MKYFKILLLVYFASQHSKVHAQTIYNNWYSERVNVCMQIKKEGYSSSINEFDWIRFKLKKNELKVIYNYSQRSIGRRLKFTFMVVMLTSDTLILARKPNNEYLEYFMLDSIIVFRAMPKSCYDSGNIQVGQAPRISGTGVGAIAGVPAAGVGVGMQVHGSTVIGVATANLIKDVIVRAQDNSNGHKSTGGSSDDGSSDVDGVTDWNNFKNNHPNHPDYVPPKKWNGKKVKNPNGKGSGYPDRKGRVWIPQTHKGTHGKHWDVQSPPHSRAFPNACANNPTTARVGKHTGSR